MNYKSTHFITLLLALFFLTMILLSRFTYSPINLSIVSGYSMYPSLRPGDLILSLHKDITGYGVGDVVIWCSTPSYCTIHRVVELRDSQVITKGDNNPSEDPPIPESYVKYKVVLVIPSIVWLSTCLILTGFYVFRNKEKIVGLKKELGNLELLVFSVFVTINLALIALVPMNYSTLESTVGRPSMSLRSVEILDPGSLILIKYNLNYLSLVSVTECLIEVSDQLIRCVAYIPASDSVIVIVPPETYEALYENRLTSFKTLINLTLDKGLLVGNYPLHISWNKVSILVNENQLILSNPNYIPINVTYVKVTYMSYDTESRTHRVVHVEELQGFTVPPRNNYSLLVESKGEYAYVMIKYLFMGEEIVEQRRINFN